MRIAVVVSGSRGDVQPMLAVALGIAAAGHETTLCASPDNGPWVRGLGLPFAALGEPLRDNPALGDWGIGAFSQFIRRQVDIQVSDLPPLVEGSDLVVASGLAFGVRPVAERLEVPYRYVSFVPAGFLGTTHDPVGVRLTRGVLKAFADLAYGSTLNAARVRLGLPRTRDVMQQLMGPVPIAATDPALTVMPRGARLRARQTGYPYLVQPGELTEELERFLADGPAPVYAGFGSMPVGNRERMSRLLVESANRAGQRMVVSRGWSGIPQVDGDGCLFIGDEPHGGAGTVATAARAGVPQIVLPQAVDQFLWRGQLVRLGLAPRTQMLRRASASSVANAIATVLQDAAYWRRATEMATRLKALPDGVAMTVAELTGSGSR